METVEATLVAGLQLASGTSTKDPIFNADGDTIHMQTTAFKRYGFDFDAYFGNKNFKRATLNLSVEPLTFVAGGRNDFEHFLEGVHWTDLLDANGKPKSKNDTAPPFLENFFLSPATVAFKGTEYLALIYLPDPATKPGQHTPPKLYIEVIAEQIPDIHYGDKVTLAYNPAAIKIFRPDVTPDPACKNGIGCGS